MKRIMILQALGVLVFAGLMVLLDFFGWFSMAGTITVYALMGILNILNAYHILVKPIEDKSEHDSLTGCHNRVRLDVRIPEYEKHDSFAVIFFDINNFKKVNDTHGHDDGDRLLVAASDQLRYWFGYGDLYRIGGDEFIVVVPNMREEKLRSLVDRWYNSQPALNAGYSDDFVVKFSYGIAVRARTESFEEVQDRADREMYKMKNGTTVR